VNLHATELAGIIVRADSAADEPSHKQFSLGIGR